MAMRSTFFGLEIGRSSLMTHQTAIDVTSQNMANASTPGYARQRAEIATTEPFTYPSFSRDTSAGQIGTGVSVEAVIRVRDELIDQQIQKETSTLGFWDFRQQMLDKMETIMNEPTDSNVRTALDDFWVAVQGVADNPATPEPRQTLLESAITLTTTIREDYAREKELRTDANQRIIEQVSRINDIGVEIANLNDQIGKITALDDHANDLMDKRDALVEELSKMVNITKTTDDYNRISVYINGIPLVKDITSNKILTERDTTNDDLVKLKWEQPVNEPVKINSGSLKALFQIRDRDLPDVLDKMNDFAGTLITKVNELHRQGYGLDHQTGYDFFSGTNALDIDVSKDISDEENGLNHIAAAGAAEDGEGNADTIKKIYQLIDSRALTNGTATMNEFIGALIAGLGASSQTAQDKYNHATLLVTNLDKRRESVMGVNMDEEATNLVRFQQGYNAAAKIISTMDEMLDVIVNKLKV